MHLPQDWVEGNISIARSRIEAGMGDERDYLIDLLACRLQEAKFSLLCVTDRLHSGNPQGLAEVLMEQGGGEDPPEQD